MKAQSISPERLIGAKVMFKVPYRNRLDSGVIEGIVDKERVRVVSLERGKCVTQTVHVGWISVIEGVHTAWSK